MNAAGPAAGDCTAGPAVVEAPPIRRRPGLSVEASAAVAAAIGAVGTPGITAGIAPVAIAAVRRAAATRTGSVMLAAALVVAFLLGAVIVPGRLALADFFRLD